MFGAGFNHFWHAESENHGGDCLYIQGHVSPGVYARAYLEGRLTEEQLLNFRQEVDGKGLSSYPHPKLMPEFWQFPTVSMGLGPLMAIYQARFLKYLHARGIANTENRKVWVFCGDGEMDEVESLGAIGLAAREKLDNLIFVINCNLQRLDGPVRGNGKIIQELEGEFRGSGWNVIKLLWGSEWDPLLARDKDGALRKLMMDTLDGDYQSFKANDGAYVRKHFFGRDPKTLEMVAKMSDDDIWALRRGGHDPQKVYAAYHKAVNHKGPAHRAADQDRQGFWHGQEWRGQEQRAPDQEAHRRGHQDLPRPLQHSHSRQRAGRRSRSTSRPTTRPKCVPARAPQGLGRLPAAPSHQGRRKLHGALARDFQERDGAHGRRP
jgi:pyruvate dehydrogenase E1 component